MRARYAHGVRAVLAVLVVLHGASVASAETAAELFAEGLKLIDQGKPAEACTKLEGALKLEPGKPGILINLGVCNAKQNKTATALGWFRRALALSAERSMAEVETVAKEQIKALSAKVPTVSITVSIEDATVTIDGISIPSTSFARLELDAGTHTLEARADGFITATRPIEVDDVPDARQPIRVELSAKKRIPEDPKGPLPAPAETGQTKRLAGLVIGGVGLVGIGLGTVFAIQASGRSDDVRDRGNPEDPPVFDPSDQDSGKRAALVSKISFAAGGALVVTGVVLYMLGKRTTTTTVGIAPTAGGSTLVIGGSF